MPGGPLPPKILPGPPSGPPKFSARRHATALKSYTDHWQLPLLQNWPLQWPPQMKMSGSAPVCSFSKNGNVQENIYRLCNVKRLEQDIKLRCNPHLYNAWKLVFNCKSDMHVRPMRFSILCTPTDSSVKTQIMCSTILVCLFTSKHDINGTRLNYSIVSSNKYKYINMYIIYKDKTRCDHCCSQNTSRNKIGNLYT